MYEGRVHKQTSQNRLSSPMYEGRVHKRNKLSSLDISLTTAYFLFTLGGPSWLWSYGSWINNYLCNQCLSPLKLWVRTQFMTRCTRCDKFCQWLATGRWFSPGTLVSSTNKTDCHYRTEILLKVALNTITLSPNLSHQYSSPSVTM